MEWIDLKNRLPLHKELCLITNGETAVIAYADLEFIKGKVYWDLTVTGYDVEMPFPDGFETHWMPVPDLPK